MSSSRFCKLLAITGLLIFLHSSLSEAQLIRRFAGGGVQIRAPFVRVNVGPGGTSVRAPFVAVDAGRTYVGRGGRRMPQPRYAAPAHPHHPGQGHPGQGRSRVRPAQATRPVPKKPDSAVNVDALPYPTAGQLAAMEDVELVETLRQMMARLHYRFSRLKTGEGWQEYLVLSREVLGSPGAAPEAANFEAVRKILPRFQSVQNDPQFAKISVLPSFTATFAALQEADRRFGNSVEESVIRQPEIGGPVINGPEFNGPEIYDPNGVDPSSVNPNSVDPGPVEETPADEPLELLPTPAPALPNATRGERSILKRT